MFTKRIALLFAIEEYDNYGPLPCVRHDVEGNADVPGLKAILTQGLGKHAFEVEVVCGRRDFDQVSSSLTAVLNKLRGSKDDNEQTLLFLYFSGHGVMNSTEPEEDQFLIATSDTEAEKPTRGVRFSSLLKHLLGLRMAVVCCIDCCRGGTAVLGTQFYTRTREKNNLAIFASCAPTEESYVAEANGQSRFTRFLIDALRGIEVSASHLREVTTESFADALKTCFKHYGQTPMAWVGKTPILLSRPGTPISVTQRISSDQISSIFKTYVEGELQGCLDYPHLTSDEFHVRSACNGFVLEGSPRAKTPAEPFQETALDRLGTWLHEVDSTLLLLMGDTGTGKSTVLRRFWHDQARAWLSGDSVRIPIIFDLRIFSGVRLLAPGEGEASDEVAPALFTENHGMRRFRAVFTDAIQNREGLPIFWHDFEMLCREGRLLLLLDGLDEMDTEGIRGAASQNLSFLMQFFGPAAKIIVTCRSHYLRNDRELIAVLSKSVPAHVAVPQLELMAFSETQVTGYMRSRLPPAKLEKWHRLRQNDTLGLTDLCRRPFLLVEIVDHFEEIVEEDRIRPSRLFYCYLRTWLKRDDWRFQRFLTDSEDAIHRDRARLDESTARDAQRSDLKKWEHRVLAGFVEILAAHLWTLNSLSITSSKIPPVIRAHLPSAPDVFINFFDYAIRTCSFLTRTGDDEYRFLDDSILEYFAVRKFRDDILNSDYPWDGSRKRGQDPVHRIPIELGRRRLTPRMADTLADVLREDEKGAKDRLAKIIHETKDRVSESPETLYYIAGNCLSVYVRLNSFSVPSGTGRLDLRRKWLNGARLAGCNLTNVDLTGALLDEVDLEAAILRGASLFGIRLVRCRLAKSDLRDVLINGDKDAVVMPVDSFDPVASNAPPRLREVYRLSNSKGPDARTFRRTSKDLGEMVFIPGGIFQMGTNAQFAQPFERPPRPIKVEPFYMDRRPVTNAEFSAFLKANPEWRKDAVSDRFGIPYYLCGWDGVEPPQRREHFPVVSVNWYAAVAYSAWVG